MVLQEYICRRSTDPWMTTIPHVAFVGSTKTVTTAKDWCRRVAVPGTCFTLHASSNTGGRLRGVVRPSSPVVSNRDPLSPDARLLGKVLMPTARVATGPRRRRNLTPTPPTDFPFIAIVALVCF